MTVVSYQTRQAFAPFAAEFLGTFFIVLCHACAVAGDPAGGWWPTAVGFASMGVIYGTFAVSGGHLNPAVSFAVYLTEKLSNWRLAGYVSSQLCGGHLAALVVLVMQQGSELSSGIVHAGVKAIAIEGIYCIVILLVTLNCSDLDTVSKPRQLRNQYFGLAIGFTILGGGQVAAGVSLSMFNPAVTICSVVLGRTSAAFGALCTLTQLAAAVPAVWLVRMFRPAMTAERDGAGLVNSNRHNNLVILARTLIPQEPREEDGKKKSLALQLTAEFVGTFVCVLTFMLCMVPVDRYAGGYHKGKAAMFLAATRKSMSEGVAQVTQHTLLAAAASTALVNTTAVTAAAAATSTPVGLASWATGSIMIGLFHTLRGVSGAHLNPAVTLSVACAADGLKCVETFSYVAVQLSAGACAGLVSFAFRGGVSHDGGRFGEAYLPGSLGDVSWIVTGLGEMLFTATLALTFLCVTCVKTPRYPKAPTPLSFDSGLAVGMCLSSGSFSLERFSGGLLNPALVLGVCIECYISSQASLTVTSLVFCRFVAFQLAGGAAAALAFVALHPLQYQPDPLLRQCR